MSSDAALLLSLGPLSSWLSVDGSPSISSVVGVSAVMFVLMPACLGLRLWSVQLTNTWLDASVLFAILAFTTTLSSLSLSIYGAVLYENNDMLTDFSAVAPILKNLMAGTILSVTSMALTKISILLVYRDAFPLKWVRLSSLITGLAICFWAIASILVLVLTCWPVSAFWDFLSMDPSDFHCMDQPTVFAYSSIPDVVFDVVLLAIPLRGASQLLLKPKTRARIYWMLAFGGVITMLAIIRLCLSMEPSTYSQAVPFTGIESGLSVICTCLVGCGTAVDRLLALVRIGPSSLSSQPEKVHLTSNLSSYSRLSRGSQHHLIYPSQTRLDISSPEPARKPCLPMRILNKVKELVEWQQMPVITHNTYPTTPGPRRNSAEINEFRRLYEYSGTNPFSQDSYARMTDTQLWGGIRVETAVVMRVEPNPDVEAGLNREISRESEDWVSRPSGTYSGRGRSHQREHTVGSQMDFPR